VKSQCSIECSRRIPSRAEPRRASIMSCANSAHGRSFFSQMQANWTALSSVISRGEDGEWAGRNAREPGYSRSETLTSSNGWSPAGVARAKRTPAAAEPRHTHNLVRGNMIHLELLPRCRRRASAWRTVGVASSFPAENGKSHQPALTSRATARPDATQWVDRRCKPRVRRSRPRSAPPQLRSIPGPPDVRC